MSDLAPDRLVYPWTSPPTTPEQAGTNLLGATGIPDLFAGGNALARGEVLPGLGQSAVGLAQLAGTLAPIARPLGLGLRSVPGVLSDTKGAIRGWHGTPHKFEPVEGNPFGEFRNSAIGSGEGAQAYGYGHYVAGNPSVAKSYRQAISSATLIDDKPLSQFDAGTDATAQRVVDALFTKGNIHDATAYLEAQHEQALPGQTKYSEALGLMQEWQKSGRLQEPGNLLEIHILPEEHELLDWDRPISEQSSSVQEALSKMKREDVKEILSKRNIAGDYSKELPTGQHLYSVMSLNDSGIPNNPTTSKALHSAGIPGIKYLDAGSRFAGSGTHNYVIFDPTNLRIIGRNGQRLEPVDHDPFLP